MKLNLVLPSFRDCSENSVEIMYHFANELNSRGFNVCIYHVMSINKIEGVKKHFFRQRLLQYVVLQKARITPSWFQLEKEITCLEIVSINNTLIRDAHVTMSNLLQIAYEISTLNSLKGKGFNLILESEKGNAEQWAKDCKTRKLPQRQIVSENLIKLFSSCLNEGLSLTPIKLNERDITQNNWKELASFLQDQFNSSMTYLERLQTIESKEFRGF